ncbi:MAG: hypothetical protein WC565_10645 [Parcubacteria group bacterium]
MAEGFIIKATCPECGHVEPLASEEDKTQPRSFDTADAAMKHVSKLARKPVRFDNAASTDENLYECGKCGAITPMHRLKMSVYRR